MSISGQYLYGSYIALFSDKKRFYIEQEVRKALFELGLKGEDLEIEVENAMSSKFCDLDDLVDVKKIIKIFEKNCTQFKS